MAVMLSKLRLEQVFWSVAGGMGAGRKSWAHPDRDGKGEERDAALAAEMAPALAEFEQVRRATFDTVQNRMKFWLPACMGGAIVLAAALHLLFQTVATELYTVLFCGSAMFAIYMATSDPISAYKAAFKSEIVPRLLARAGDFKLREQPQLDVAALSRCGLLPDGSDVKIEDEFYGLYRNRNVAIAEIKIEKSGKDEDTVVLLDGLMMEFDLPREVAGKTMIAPVQWDAYSTNFSRIFGKLGFATAGQYEAVVLESAAFNDKYRVLSTDQVGARVLLSPGFMERMIKLSPKFTTRTVASFSWIERCIVEGLLKHSMIHSTGVRYASGLARRFANDSEIARQLNRLSSTVDHSGVVAIAQNGKLTIAMPKGEDIDYFEPPPYFMKADGDALLTHLAMDIRQMLDVADAVFDLDYRTRVKVASG